MNSLNHIAFICDGNGRWAKKQGKDRSYGHKAGSDVVKDITLYLKDKYNVSHVSFYIFSTENWKRPKSEVKFIIMMMEKLLDQWAKLFESHKVKIKFVGSRKNLDNKLIKLFEKYEEYTKDGDEMTLNLCFNYGGKTEIVEAVQNIVDDKISNITEEVFEKYLYTANQPEVDLLIRTSGEQRISNFYLWQLAYSEMVFLDCYWPDLNETIMDNVIDEYINRNRRYGGI